jgi:hypothetical protein
MDSKKHTSNTLPTNSKKERKLYNAPKLILFGNVASLTASMGSLNGDGGQSMMI